MIEASSAPSVISRFSMKSEFPDFCGANNPRPTPRPALTIGFESFDRSAAGERSSESVHPVASGSFRYCNNIYVYIYMLDCRVNSKSLILFVKKSYLGPRWWHFRNFWPSWSWPIILSYHDSFGSHFHLLHRPRDEKMRNWKRGGTLDIRCRKLSMCRRVALAR